MMLILVAHKMSVSKLIFAGAAFLMLTATGCIDDFFICGNGVPGSETRQTPSFSSVSSEGNFSVYISPGETYEVLLQAETNLLPYIETEVRRKNLRIFVHGMNNLRNRLPMEVYITVPFIENVVQSGSGSINTEHFDGDDFKFVISGSGSIETSVDAISVNAIISGSGNLYIAGVAWDADMVISGSGEIDAWDLSLHYCEAMISGSGDIWVDVDRWLKATISGSGNIYYRGTPEVESVVSGSGRIIRKN